MGLIDTDKLLELIKDQKEREIGAYTKGINAGLNIVKSIINDETQTPTAYDVDKVVEQLDNLKRYSNPYDSYYEETNYRATEYENSVVNRLIDDVIKIVKAGGIDER